MEDRSLKIPNHVGIIVDGNGRWAKKKGMSRSEGHSEGAKNLINLSRYIFSKGIKILSVFVFSTENFKRSKQEVDYLMNLFVTMFNQYCKDLKKENVKIVFSGRREFLPKKVLEVMDKVIKTTKDNNNGILNVCLNYGGQAEIVDATKKMIDDVLEKRIKKEEINEELFSKYLYNDLPPIDFLIRTSGELRISNFILWQLAYAELYFPKTYFPDFKEKEFDEAILEYNKRNRRFGGINYEDKNS
ncbi:MAG: di-trans,poly-cis-decaprenylcistransferase [Mollicutes bacterium]|nr:di-trans,poly-cis-decaprenylcistransferase [Mollicutes bacterium]